MFKSLSRLPAPTTPQLKDWLEKDQESERLASGLLPTGRRSEKEMKEWLEKMERRVRKD